MSANSLGHFHTLAINPHDAKAPSDLSAIYEQQGRTATDRDLKMLESER